MPNKRKKHWPDGWSTQGIPDNLTKAEIKRLVKWMRCVVEWGEDLRDDLIRLEGKLGISVGDPGDPPPPPWSNDD